MRRCEPLDVVETNTGVGTSCAPLALRRTERADKQRSPPGGGTEGRARHDAESIELDRLLRRPLRGLLRVCWSAESAQRSPVETQDEPSTSTLGEASLLSRAIRTRPSAGAFHWDRAEIRNEGRHVQIEMQESEIQAEMSAAEE